MGLIKESNAEYYSGQKVLGPLPSNTSTLTFGNSATGQGFNTTLISAYNQAGDQILSSSNFNLFYATTLQQIPESEIYIINPSTNEVGLQNQVLAGDFILCQLKEYAINKNYGDYSYISLNDIVDNFIIGYTGVDQILNDVKRTNILFHAKRSLQELSYDTLPCLKSQELTIPPSLSVPIPQDYVNYVRVAWSDTSGVLHTINPLEGLSTNPTEIPIQDSNGIPTQNSFGENNEAQQSLIEEEWANANDNNITGAFNMEGYSGVYDYVWWKYVYGRRFGLDPQYSNSNGWFSINERTGNFSFSSDLANRTIVLKYISDGLGSESDMRVPKLAEEAMYASIMYNVIATRRNIDPGTKAFYKKEKSVKTRNAKIRLSNIKLDTFTQVMRGKSKWIKH